MRPPPWRSTDKVVTIGVEPTRPATGFGYIRAGARPRRGHRRQPGRAVEFVEKPDAVHAAEYVAAGEFRWNAGMFVVVRRPCCSTCCRSGTPSCAEGLRAIAADPLTAGRGVARADQDRHRPRRRGAGGGCRPGRRRARDVRVGRRRGLRLAWRPCCRRPARGDLRVLGDAGGRTAVDARGRGGPAGGRRVAVVGLDDVVVVDTPDALLVTTRSAGPGRQGRRRRAQGRGSRRPHLTTEGLAGHGDSRGGGSARKPGRRARARGARGPSSRRRPRRVDVAAGQHGRCRANGERSMTHVRQLRAAGRARRDQERHEQPPHADDANRGSGADTSEAATRRRPRRPGSASRRCAGRPSAERRRRSGAADAGGQPRRRPRAGRCRPAATSSMARSHCAHRVAAVASTTSPRPDLSDPRAAGRRRCRKRPRPRRRSAARSRGRRPRRCPWSRRASRAGPDGGRRRRSADRAGEGADDHARGAYPTAQPDERAALEPPGERERRSAAARRAAGPARAGIRPAPRSRRSSRATATAVPPSRVRTPSSSSQVRLAP